MYEIVFFLFLSLKIIEEQNKELNFRMTKHYILYTFFLIFWERYFRMDRWYVWYFRKSFFGNCNILWQLKCIKLFCLLKNISWKKFLFYIWNIWDFKKYNCIELLLFFFFSYYIRNIWNTFVTQRIEGTIKNLFIRNFWNSIVISRIIKKLLTSFANCKYLWPLGI